MPRRSRSSGASLETSPKRLRYSARLASERTVRDAALGGDDQTGRRMNVGIGDFLDHNRALKPIDATEDTQLKCLELDLHRDENRSAHHSDQYADENLIVRRGQEFDLSVTLSREYNKEADTILIQLTTGARPQESKGTVLRIKVGATAQTSTDNWQAVIHSAEGTSVKIGVTPSSDAIIGWYHVFVETETKTDDDKILAHRKEFEEKFMVLFNAWCQDDAVFMSDEAERNEYVMADYGRVWMGTQFSNYGKPWNFGQFEDPVLDAVFRLLDLAELSDGARSNPTKIVRCIAALANSSDGDRGILTGRWTDEFPKNCTLPWSWTGSVAIIDEYMRTKKAVEYGQCWVFSALVTTLLRCLGIPTRSVTNFESAHDTDGSITIDYHWNDEDEPEDNYNDSVWNFHVWNESFFKRPDLPDGYDGWQALDATPQEASEGVMRCGPASLKAIKEGHVYLPHDAPFIFAEVNGDKVHWLVKDDGSMECLGKETNSVGHKISTKAVGRNERHDLTLDYKYREGSAEERASVHRAFRYSSRREHAVYDVPAPDVTLTLAAPDAVEMGDSFTLKVSSKNTSSEKRTVTLRLTAVASYYTGVPSEKIGTKVYTEELQPDETKISELEITSAMYSKFLRPDSIVTVYLKGRIHETKRAYAKMQSFEILKPGLTLEVPEKVGLGETFSITVKFKNPLDEKLTGGVFHIEASGITKPRKITHRKAIQPKEEVSFAIDHLTPSRAGKREIQVNFTSNQLIGLVGTNEVYVSYSAR